MKHEVHCTSLSTFCTYLEFSLIKSKTIQRDHTHMQKTHTHAMNYNKMNTRFYHPVLVVTPILSHLAVLPDGWH